MIDKEYIIKITDVYEEKNCYTAWIKTKMHPDKFIQATKDYKDSIDAIRDGTSFEDMYWYWDEIAKLVYEFIDTDEDKTIFL